MKPHEFRELVNALRDTARQYHAHDSLRERISGVLRRGLRFEDHARPPENTINLVSLMAMNGSCRCLTKTPDPECHKEECPYRKLQTAEERFEAWFLSLPDVDETLLTKGGKGMYADTDMSFAFAAFCAGMKV